MEQHDTIQLVFVGHGLSTDQIQAVLGAQAPCKTGISGPTTCELTLAKSSDPEMEQGELIDWCESLRAKSAEIAQLSSLGCDIYMDCALRSRDVFVDREVIELLARLGMGLSVWFKSTEQNEKSDASPYQLVIPEPPLWFSQLDENAFYTALTSIPAVQSLEVRPGRPLPGEPNQITLSIDQPFLDEESLRNLIGIMFRYSLDLSPLAKQCTEDNARWLKDPTKYWYQGVFGKRQDLSGDAD